MSSQELKKLSKTLAFAKRVMDAQPHPTVSPYHLPTRLEPLYTGTKVGDKIVSLGYSDELMAERINEMRNRPKVPSFVKKPLVSKISTITKGVKI